MTIETFEDGWDCVPELKEVVETIEELDYMVTQMKDLLEEALSKLEDINTNKEFVTVIDND